MSGLEIKIASYNIKKKLDLDENEDLLWSFIINMASF